MNLHSIVNDLATACRKSTSGLFNGLDSARGALKVMLATFLVNYLDYSFVPCPWENKMIKLYIFSNQSSQLGHWLYWDRLKW